jgi:dUTP pyrophosphatase
LYWTTTPRQIPGNLIAGKGDGPSILIKNLFINSLWNGEQVLDRVIVKIKRLEGNSDLPLPSYESEGSSGMDIRASVKEPVHLRPGEIRLIPTGLAVSIPRGYEGQVRPRSGLALKHGIGMVNSPGTIDSDYRGEIGIIVINWGEKPFSINRGDRIAQLIITRAYQADILEVDDLDSTQRGGGGFGHSGVK